MHHLGSSSSSLLSYKNVELAEVSMVNLLELKLRVDGNYLLLSNIYSKVMKWDNVMSIRRMTKSTNV